MVFRSAEDIFILERKGREDLLSAACKMLAEWET